MTRIAVLDDWQNIARGCADWSALAGRAEVVFFDRALDGEDEAARQLADFDILLTMRERTAFPASLVRRLPRLRMLGMTGMRAASIDLAALAGQGVTVCGTSGGGNGAGTAELTLGLILAAVRRIADGHAAIRAGRFQDGVAPGVELEGKTLGVIGLGRLGQRLARYASALDMKVIAWSQNLTASRAAEAGVAFVAKDELLATADVVTLHLVLSDRTRGLIGTRELRLMKPGAVLVNTSRGPIVDEVALVAAVQSGRLIAALDVYDREPLPQDHPLRRAPNVLLTPHLGYGTVETFQAFYRESVENAVAFLDGRPMRVIAPPRNQAVNS